jgi:hypothetical protein
MWYDDDDVLLLPVKFLLLPLAAVGAVRVCGRRRSTISLYYLTYLVSLFSPFFLFYIFHCETVAVVYTIMAIIDF